MPDLERVQQNTPLTLSQQWYEGGVAVDPGTVTIGIVRADGTELVAPATATSGSGTAARAYNLTTTHTALLDRLTVTWTSTLKGTLTSIVEVVGGFLFSISDFRALGTAYANTTNYPTTTVVDMRTTVEQALEDACGVAFVPRYERETVNGTYSTLLPVKWARVRTLRDVTVDDVAGTVADYVALREGMLYGTSYWARGYGNVTVGYEHGHDTPPMRIKRAALILAKRWITPGSADDRAINVSNETGTYALFQAGVRGHQFDVPEVQAAVDQYSLAVGVV
jgi:hypothetical protein